jgi:hypothetical protein
MMLLYTVHYNNKKNSTISYYAITYKCVLDNADGPRCFNPELLYQWKSQERRRLLARKCYLLSKGQVHKYTPNKDIASCGVFHTARLKKFIHSGVTSWPPSCRVCTSPDERGCVASLEPKTLGMVLFR